jgi:hypothetical protein
MNAILQSFQLIEIRVWIRCSIRTHRDEFGRIRIENVWKTDSALDYSNRTQCILMMGIVKEGLTPLPRRILTVGSRKLSKIFVGILRGSIIIIFFALSFSSFNPQRWKSFNHFILQVLRSRSLLRNPKRYSMVTISRIILIKVALRVAQCRFCNFLQRALLSLSGNKHSTVVFIFMKSMFFIYVSFTTCPQLRR